MHKSGMLPIADKPKDEDIAGDRHDREHLANGCQLRFDQRIDARTLRRIVGVLRG